MFINENYDYPSQLQDSLSGSESQHNPSIREVHLYELEQQHQQPGVDCEPQSLGYRNEQLESSVESDGFLEMVHDEEQIAGLSKKGKGKKDIQSESRDRQVLLADRTNIELLMLETQSARETIVFTNITSTKIRMKFNQCPFQIQNNQMLGFLLAEQLQVVIQPWDRAELSFAIEPQSSSFGDIIETVVVTSEFIGRQQSILPIAIRFHVRYISPKLTLKYEGATEVLSLRDGKLAIANIKANKVGEYQLILCLGEGIQKMEMTVQSRGKVSSSAQSLMLYRGQSEKIRLRPRGRLLSNKQRSGLLLKPINTQICYVIGLQLTP